MTRHTISRTDSTRIVETVECCSTIKTVSSDWRQEHRTCFAILMQASTTLDQSLINTLPSFLFSIGMEISQIIFSSSSGMFPKSSINFENKCGNGGPRLHIL